MKRDDLFHPDYTKHDEVWTAIEHCCEGGRAVKRQGTVYLPKLTDESEEEYKSRKFRAVFFNATRRTREAQVGMLLRKAPKITVPKEVEILTADIDMEGGTIKNWIRAVVTEVVSIGRGVTVADWNDAEKRPYLSFYPARNVTNWSVERVDGRNKLALLVLKESVETRVDGTVVKSEQFRQYSLDQDGKVTVKVWTIGKEGEAEAGDETILTRSGTALTEIPAIFHNASHIGPSIGIAPLADIADLNLAHYNGSADLENGRHICGIPTPYATGVRDDDKALKLGSTTAWTSEDPNAKFGFIEFTGQGLESLVTGQAEKEKQMAILGARLLSNESKDGEAYDTVRLRAASESASLSNTSGHLTLSLTAAIRWFAWWAGAKENPTEIDEKVGIVMNDDFVDTPMSETMLSSLVQALQANAISMETFFHNLEQGEVYPPDWDLAKETAAIAQRPPTITPPTADPVPDDDE